MCLPNFKEFKIIKKDNPLIGYRNWVYLHKDNILMSESIDYIWFPNKKSEGPHKVVKENSGIYAYNYNNYNNYNNNNNNYNYNNNNNNNYNYIYYNYYYNNNNNYYKISGIIHQYGKVAIHRLGQRSQYAKIQTFFTIREFDAQGSDEFIKWIKLFNQQIRDLAKSFRANTMHWQDFIESNDGVNK